MTERNGSDLGKRFLKDIDCYLAEKLQSSTCADIAKLYFDFFTDLKEF
jgi:hypothetical protein